MTNQKLRTLKFFFTIFRQRIVLSKNNYAIIQNHIVNDIEMQSILQFTRGSICKLNELIGGFDNLNKFWHLHPDLIRSKTCMIIDYFHAILHCGRNNWGTKLSYCGIVYCIK